MFYTMPKETRLNLRISGDFRQQIETLAAYHGLSLSGLAHSLLVKAVRREFQDLDARGESPLNRKAPVVARIEPARDPRDQVRKDLGIPFGGTVKLTGEDKKKRKAG